MRSKCLFILTLLTGIFFVMSALELNTDSIKNTFDDEYDHYILPDLAPVHAAVTQFYQDRLPILEVVFFNAYRFINQCLRPSCAKSGGRFTAAFRHPPKIYLIYRLLRI